MDNLFKEQSKLKSEYLDMLRNNHPSNKITRPYHLDSETARFQDVFINPKIDKVMTYKEEVTVKKNKFQITFSKTENKFELQKVIWLFGRHQDITDFVILMDMEDIFLDEIREEYEKDNRAFDNNIEYNI